MNEQMPSRLTTSSPAPWVLPWRGVLLAGRWIVWRICTANDGGKRLKPHELRKTFRTMMSRIKIDPQVAELCIGHVEKETMRRVYDGHDYWPEMVDAWDRAGAHIAALRNGSAIIIPLAKRMA
jgi:integrase